MALIFGMSYLKVRICKHVGFHICQVHIKKKKQHRASSFDVNPCQAQELVVKQRHTTWNIANQQHGKTVSQKDINKKRTPPTKTYKNNVFIWKKSQDRSYQTTGSSHSHRYPSLLNDFETLDHFEHLRSALLESIASKSTMRAAFLFGTHVTPVWRTNKTSESKAPNKNKKKCVYIYIPSWTHDSSSGFSWWCNLQEFWILGSTILMANLGDLLMSWGSAYMTSLSVPARCPLPSTSILSKIFCKSFLGYNWTGSLQPFNKANWHQQTCLSPAPYHYIECDGYHYELIPCQTQLSIVVEPENHPWEGTTQQKCNWSKQMAQFHTAVYCSKGLW